MEKRCMFFTALATATIFAVAILFFIIYTTSEDVCTSRRCVQSANELMTTLDQSVDPCVDFYDFACGGIRRLLAQGEKRRAYNENEDNSDDAKANAVRDMIEEPPNPYDTKTLSKIKTFYRSCMHEPTGNETFTVLGGVTADGIRAALRDIGGWPMLERGNWREDRFDWITTVHHLARNGILEDIFIQTSVQTNQYDITKYILSIRISNDYLDDARINTESDKKLLLEYSLEIALFFGVDRMRAERDLRDIMEFLEQLIRQATRSNEAINVFNPRSITQLQHDVPNLSWRAYINELLGPGLELSADEFVNVPNVDELKRLIDLLHRTPKKILANYLCWRIVQTYAPYFIEKGGLHERLAKFPKFHSRWNRREICSRLIRKTMEDAVETCYVHRYVTDDVKRAAKEVVDAIRKQLINTADQLDWLDEDARRVALEKLASVRDYVAHAPPDAPPTWPEVYERLDFAEDRFVANLRALQAANADIKYRKLRQPVVQHEYREIEYSVINNYLVLPSDYLQPFYIDASRPMYMNFGLLGTLIAHQLSEVFLEGRRYDSHGELREWSTSQSLFNYDNKTRCLTKQYEQFHVPGFGPNINASETQLDDVAVLFSKLIAYKSYISWLDSHESEGRLPGLQYSTRQLYWIASAMDECHRQQTPLPPPPPPQSARSISKLRVVGPLRNAEDFAEDFRCPIDTYMHPAEKCALW
ncbi:neprilysin-2-like [Atheta coriaria]|uniref:neprilysin-2-like n=1 Tax=Dalotia coriaria TaxID=877792 RepID=UPI0031F386C3